MTPAAPPNPELRILHWNVHSWADAAGRSNVADVGDVVLSIDPDVISLVEVDELTTGPLLLEVLAADFSYCCVFAPAFEYGGALQAGQFGNALLSRTPFLNIRHHNLLLPPPNYDGTEQSEPRSLTIGRVQSDIGSVWVGTTHLPRSDRDLRLDAAKRAILCMQKLSAPWILAGDFNMNASAWSEVYSPFRACLPHPGPTYPTDYPVEGIDYYIAAGALQVEVKRLDSSASDHLPILASVRSSDSSPSSADLVIP